MLIGKINFHNHFFGYVFWLSLWKKSQKCSIFAPWFRGLGMRIYFPTSGFCFSFFMENIPIWFIPKGGGGVHEDPSWLLDYKIKFLKFSDLSPLLCDLRHWEWEFLNIKVDMLKAEVLTFETLYLSPFLLIGGSFSICQSLLLAKSRSTSKPVDTVVQNFTIVEN